MRGRIVFRLALLYGGLFLLFSIGIYFWANHTFTRYLFQHLDDHLHDEIVELERTYIDHGTDVLLQALLKEGEAQENQKAFYRLITPDQQVVVSSDLSGWTDLRFPNSDLAGFRPGEEHWHDLHLSAHATPVRVVSRMVPDGRIIQAGMEIGQSGEMLVLFQRVMLITLGAVLLLGSLGGGWIVHRAMRGVRRVTETALGIGQNNLQVRVPLQNEGEEIDRLAAAFNAMLNRIASLVHELKEVSDNIAHDLKRPVTRIRGLAEMSLAPARTPQETREAAGQIIEECDHLVGMVNTMLEIARLDAVGTADPRQPVDLVHLAHSAAELFEPLAEDRGLRIAVRAPETPVWVGGHPAQLQRAVANLLDNAILYSDRGTIVLSVESARDACRLTVADEGPGIPPEARPRIFDRFYRADPSRSRPGSGLGLSLVKSIVQAHAGEVDVETEPGKGSRFTLSLPPAPQEGAVPEKPSAQIKKG